MKSNWVNSVHVEGYVFSHTLKERVSKKTGTPFIMGDLQVMTDLTNVVTVHFTYVTEVFGKSGKPNATYGVLQNIIHDCPTYETDGEMAKRVRVDGRVEVNDFYNRDGELVSTHRIGGSFVHFMNPTDKLREDSSTFETDMLITRTATKEYNDTDVLELYGYCFNFRGDVLPVKYNVRTPEGIGYFEDQDYPLLTKVWGNIVSTTIEKQVESESAFGAAKVRTTSQSLRSWDVVGASIEPMEFDDESTITKKELKQAIADREVMLADIKKRQDEYEASKNGKDTAFAKPSKSTKPVVIEEDDDEEEVYPW